MIVLTDEQMQILQRNGYDIAWHGIDDSFDGTTTTIRPWLILQRLRGIYSRRAIDRRCYSWDDCLKVMVDDKMGSLTTDEDTAFNEDYQPNHK